MTDQESYADSWGEAGASVSASPVEGRPQKRQKKDVGELQEDFLSFIADESKFAVQTHQKSNGSNGAVKNLEAEIASKFDVQRRSPWLSRSTLQIRDIFLFLHSEILDFVEFVSQTKQEKEKRKAVVSRLKQVV